MCGIEILYTDSFLIAANKPAGLLSVPGIGSQNQDCLIARVQHQFPSARIVHRLDRATSGVMVLALDESTHRALSGLFRERQIRKTYIAVVAGIVQDDSGEIALPVRLDIEHRRRTHAPLYIVDHIRGKPAITKWAVSERHDATTSQREPRMAATRLTLNPITGRSHQLRVHLSAIGHPILGEDIYAPPNVREATNRLMLHAESLELAHPCSGNLLRFATPAPF